MITTDDIKALRDKTGISVMQCKKALEEAGGDMEKALVLLRKKGADIAAKKADREIKSGIISSYIHGTGTVGAMVLLACETDFVANNEEFKILAKDIAMQITATNPEFLRSDSIPEDSKKTARAAFEKDVASKPKNMQEKIMEGKVASYFKEKVLLEQPFIKNPDLTIQDLISGAIQKFGENITVAKFSRFSI